MKLTQNDIRIIKSRLQGNVLELAQTTLSLQTALHDCRYYLVRDLTNEVQELTKNIAEDASIVDVYISTTPIQPEEVV